MRTLLFFLVGSVAFSLGCTDDPGPDLPDTGSVVVGVTSELRAGVDVTRLHVKQAADGKVVAERDFGAELTFPTEFRFDSLRDGTPVDIELAAFPSEQNTLPLLTRVASTEVVADRTL